MLIQVSDAPLGRLILRIAGRYARTVQKHLHTTGHLFEKRYHAVLVDADEYLLELIRYIHLNPVRARMVATPCQYRWSSRLTYLDKCERSWVTTDFALSMFHKERSAAVAAYRRFIDEEIGKAASSPLEDVNSSEPRILGSDNFTGKLLGDSWKPKSRKSLQDLINEACQLFGVTEADLRSPSARRQLTKSRA